VRRAGATRDALVSVHHIINRRFAGGKSVVRAFETMQARRGPESTPEGWP
jgi:hypothetical protein